MLGCGNSDGVPAIGGADGRGDWGRCDPANSRNRRTRASLHIQHEGIGLLIDASPDLREQLLANRISCVTHVIFTHDHADHSHGIHELRQLARIKGDRIDTFADGDTHARIEERFNYAYAQPPGSFYQPILRGHAFKDRLKIDAMEVRSFAQDHGFGMQSLGLRIGDFAYSTDAVQLDEAAFAALGGVRIWIVDALQDMPHPTHAHVERTFEWIERVKPERAILTHMSNRLDYETLKRRCPPGVEPGYDGLTIDC